MKKNSQSIQKPKIVGVGLNRTGTNTLKKCLRHWGFKHQSWKNQNLKDYCQFGYRGIADVVSKFESFDDWPWPLAFREIDAAYKNALFILTKRKDSDVWFKSICKHYSTNVAYPGDLKMIFGIDKPEKNEKRLRAYYDQHLKSVRRHFRFRKHQLLEVCWENGDGWKELSEFLKLPQPTIPFPHANKTGAGLGEDDFSEDGKPDSTDD